MAKTQSQVNTRPQQAFKYDFNPASNFAPSNADVVMLTEPQ